MCPDFGTPKNNKFSMRSPHGKFIILGVLKENLLFLGVPST